VAGYYTLSNLSMRREDFPPELTVRKPKYRLFPVTLLGRLARHQKYRGGRIGELLLADALQRSWRLSREAGSFAVIADALNEKAVNFYLQFGFRCAPDSFRADISSPRRVFIPMSVIDDIATREEWALRMS
jgi:predicted GNAT family N-acyltransferase